MAAGSNDPRRATNPLFNDNKFKLGTFATNVSIGAAVTTVIQPVVFLAEIGAVALDAGNAG